MAEWKVTIVRNSLGVVQSASAYDGIGFTYTKTPNSEDINSNVEFYLRNGAVAFVNEAIDARNTDRREKARSVSEAALIEEKFKERDV